MIRGYLFALDPTHTQEQAFRSHCGAQRYAYNFGLALIRANLDQRAAERKAKTRVTALHTRVANSRRDSPHKLTTRLVRDHDTIVVEDLHVAGMVRNPRLARHISGLGMGEFRRQVEYKAADAGVRVVVANRWYPSSKTCSACGAVRAKLTLAEREFMCETCGARLARDLNAAVNLAALALREVATP